MCLSQIEMTGIRHIYVYIPRLFLVSEGDLRLQVRWEQRFSGTFRELLDLRYFPFDVQTLSIELRLNSKYDDQRGRYAVSYEKVQKTL